MWIICDENDVVVDKSSHEENLSRGYTFPNYQKYEIARSTNVKLGDSYDGVKVTFNIALRNARELAGVKMGMVEASMRIDKANSLGFTETEANYRNEYDALDARKTELES